MGFNINFNGDEANSWLADLEALNDETENLLNEVKSNLQDIEQSGSGNLISALADVGAGVVNGFNSLITANGNLANKFKQILHDFADKVQEITETISNVAGRAFGGGSKKFDTHKYTK